MGGRRWRSSSKSITTSVGLWQWICGMPERVRGFCHFGKYHDIEVEDDVTAYVEYKNGATGTFITTTGKPRDRSPGNSRRYGQNSCGR